MVGISALPKEYSFIADIPGLPKIVREGLKEYGLLEAPGTPNNPTIIAWADEVGKAKGDAYAKWAADWYNKDSIPWCGLYAAVIACRSAEGTPAPEKRMPPRNYLSALAWADFGEPVAFKDKNGYALENIITGDIAVFTRSGGGHVGIILGVSPRGSYVYVLGGNQSDQVNIMKFPVGRLYAVRRVPYTIRPAGAVNLRMTSQGKVSTNEA